MRNLITLTDEQIEAAFDEAGILCAVEDLTFTAETLADFESASASYAACGALRHDTTSTGLNVLFLDAAQVRKGAPRRDVVVVDFGGARAAYL